MQTEIYSVPRTFIEGGQVVMRNVRMFLVKRMSDGRVALSDKDPINGPILTREIRVWYENLIQKGES